MPRGSPRPAHPRPLCTKTDRKHVQVLGFTSPLLPDMRGARPSVACGPRRVRVRPALCVCPAGCTCSQFCASGKEERDGSRWPKRALVGHLHPSYTSNPWQSVTRGAIIAMPARHVPRSYSVRGRAAQLIREPAARHLLLLQRATSGGEDGAPHWLQGASCWQKQDLVAAKGPSDDFPRAAVPLSRSAGAAAREVAVAAALAPCVPSGGGRYTACAPCAALPSCEPACECAALPS